MGMLSGKKNTVLSRPHLCKSCIWGQFMTGYGDLERLAVCTNTSPNMVIPFAMLECSCFSDRHRPDWEPATKPTGSTRPDPMRSKAGRLASVEALGSPKKMSPVRLEDGTIAIDGLIR
jgi:hypothetical protein